MASEWRLSSLLSRSAFDAEGASACVVDPRGIVIAVNRAWDEFARANGGDGRAQSGHVIGKRLVDAIEGVEPRELAERALERAWKVAAEGRDPAPAEHHQLHCDTPQTTRRLNATFQPLKGDDGVFVLITYTVLIETLRGEMTEVPDLSPFVSPRGMIRQCSGCRRVVETETGAYRFIPAFVATAHSNVSHTMCPVCLDLWFGSGTWVEP